jgi:membrane protease YdiL (CAAX protease family)
LLALGVMVSAPLWEELLFRGLLPTLARKLRGSGSHSMMVLAFAAALLLRWESINKVLHEGFLPLLLAALPPLFVLAMVPLYAVVCQFSRTENGPVVFATALLFGAVHSSVWPTPIALFILALGLGWLAVWTRSLVASVVVHALFNAVSYALLLSGH